MQLLLWPLKGLFELLSLRICFTCPVLAKLEEVATLKPFTTN